MNFENHILPFLVILLIGYLFGSIPTGYLFCKYKGINIFEYGSKNPGYTNVKRVLGKKNGYIVFVLDILKAIIPIMLIFFLFPYNLYNDIISNNSNLLLTLQNLIKLYTGVGVVLGHSYPIFMKFKGGKGIACTAGVILTFSLVYIIFAYSLYKIISKTTKYVSLGSIIAVSILSILATILCIFKIMPFNFEYNYLILPAFYIITFTCIIKHKDNIIRLMQGKENKTD